MPEPPRAPDPPTASSTVADSASGRDRRAAPAVAPFPERRHGFFARHERAVQVVTLAALAWGLVYLTWRIGWSGRGAAPLPYGALLGAEIFGYLSLAGYALLAWRVPAAFTPPARRNTPTVDVFVCTYDEPTRILEATLAGCAAIRYPHTTWLLDDGPRPEMAELARRFGARYVTRPDNEHAKAGNVNHALGVTSGELVLVLDADHVPLPGILEETVGYFDDPGVALVQTPHDFSNRDSFQHTSEARHEQSLFYEIVARGKDDHNSMYWCGSAALIRRDALDDVGGVRTETIAEDFHTTIAMHARGWRTRYHPRPLVQGIAPHDLGSFLLQRSRWARGNLRVFRTRENPITVRGLSAHQRLSYVVSLANYLGGLQRFVLLAVLVATLLTGRLPMTASVTTLLVFWLPWSLLAFTTTLALARGTLGAFDSTVYGFSTMGIFTRATASLWSRTDGRFRVTPKEGVDLGGRAVLRMLGGLCVLAGVLAAVLVARVLAAFGVVTLPPLAGLALAVTVAVGVWELGCIGRTIVPALRRRQRRVQYRFPVEIHARIDATRTVVRVLDLSPDGLAFASPVAWTRGRRVRLLTRLPGSDGALHDIELKVEVRGARYVEADADADGGARGHWRIGCALVDLADATRMRLVDYCYVVQPAAQLGTGTAAVVDITADAGSARAVS